jgi:hypothetical protein
VIARVGLLAALCLTLLACDQTTGIALTIDAHGLAGDARDRVRLLAFGLAGDPRDPQLVTVQGLDPTERVLVLTPGDTDVQILVAAFDAEEQAIAAGMGALVRVPRSKRVEQTIALGPGSSSDLGGGDQGGENDLSTNDAAMVPAPFALRSRGSLNSADPIVRRIAFAEIGDGHMLLVGANQANQSVGAIFAASKSVYLTDGFVVPNVTTTLHPPELVFTASALAGEPNLVVFHGDTATRYPWNGGTGSFGAGVGLTGFTESASQKVIQAWGGLERHPAVGETWRADWLSRIALFLYNPPKVAQFDGASGSWVLEGARLNITYPALKLPYADLLGCAPPPCTPMQMWSIVPNPQFGDGQILTRQLGSTSVLPAISKAQTGADLQPRAFAAGNFDGKPPVDFVYTDSFAFRVRIALRDGGTYTLLDGPPLLNLTEADDARIAVGDLDNDTSGDEIVVTLPAQDKVLVLRLSGALVETTQIPSKAPANGSRLAGVALDALIGTLMARYDVALARQDGTIEVWENQWP